MEAVRTSDRTRYARCILTLVKYEFLAKHYQDVLHEVRTHLEDERCTGSAAELSYIAWASAREIDAASELYWRTLILARYSANPMCAKLLLDVATQEIDRQEFAAAAKDLRAIVDNYSKTKESADAIGMLKSLTNVHVYDK